MYEILISCIQLCQIVYTSKRKRTVSTWKRGLIFLTVWISFHSFATKYVLHMLTGMVALRTPPSPGWEIKWVKGFHLQLSYKGSKRISVQMIISVTFNSFKNLSFRSLPINKEYIYGNLGYELMQKLQSLRMTKQLKSSTLSLLMKAILIL